MSQQYTPRSNSEEKAQPTAEKSLNNISWHLKTLVEEIKKFNETMKSGHKEPERPIF